MSRNIRMPGSSDSLRIVDAVCTEGPNDTSPVSGDPVLISGNLPGTAMADKDSVTGLTPVRIDPHVAEFIVKGIKVTGNSVLVAGDTVYIQSDGTLDGNSVGIPFGIIWGNSLRPETNVLGTDTRTGTIVGSGATTTYARVLVGVVPKVSKIGYSQIRMFISTEQTGTGSAQNIAHGLGAAPTKVFIAPTDTAPSTAGVFTVTEGSHDATDVIVTVTSGKKFKVLAIV